MRERLRDDEEPPRERDDEPLLLPREDVLRDRDDEPLLLPRDEVLRDRDEEPRDEEPRDDEAFDDVELDLREDVDELLRRDDDARRREPVRRSAAGISSCATAFVSCGISFSRNFAIRSSSRRMPRASFAVSLSPTVSASVSIDV